MAKCVRLVSLGLEETSCFKLVLASGARGAVSACSSGGCSLVDGTCLFSERVRQSTPFMEGDKGVEG